MKKVLAIVLAALLLLAVVGCAPKPAEEKKEDDPNAGMPNPVVEVKDAKEFETQLGIKLEVPENAEKVVTNIIGGEIAEVRYTSDGEDVIARASKTTKDYKVLTGLNGEWSDPIEGTPSTSSCKIDDTDWIVCYWEKDGVTYVVYGTDAITVGFEAVIIML